MGWGNKPEPISRSMTHTDVVQLHDALDQQIRMPCIRQVGAR
jgi:hypothetical protein